MNRRFPHVSLTTAALLVAAASGWAPPRVAAQTPAPATEILAVTEFSPAFLGMYRKVMEIEAEIRRYADKYGVDYDLARAVVIQESGGNADLNSAPGANGYFQLMPATFASLKVQTNIEAGLTYLSQMIARFGREDYAVGAYNGGPSRITSGRPPLETLQYILSVETYRMVIRMHDAAIRHHATQIDLETVRLGDTWSSLSARLGVPIVQLRLHNPFLATRALRTGRLMAYPQTPRTDLVVPDGQDLRYRGRIGDNYLHLAFTFGVARDDLREANKLWHLGTLPPGMEIRIPMDWSASHNEHRVATGDTLESIAARYRSNPWRIIRDNGLWDERLAAGTVLRIRPEPEQPASPKPTFVTYRVSRGDTLSTIARRHRTSVPALQRANDMGGRTVIRVGQHLRVPATANE